MKVRKAVIPAAGLGTRFLPATKAIPKEMLPIVDIPIIEYIVKEAVDSAAYGAIGGAAAVGSFLVAPATLAGTAAAVVFDTAINAAGYMTSVADVLKNDTECDK